MTDTMVDKDLVEPMKIDIASALEASLGPYGCSHNAGDPLNVWVSQNIWRDCIAHYLGQPVPDLTPRYWNLQVWSNTKDQHKCYIDTYLNNNLCMYPRGITIAGYFLSLAGLQIDRTESLVQLKPVFQNGKIPLFPLADWKTGRIPMLVAENGQYEVAGRGIINKRKFSRSVFFCSLLQCSNEGVQQFFRNSGNFTKRIQGMG